MPPMSAVVGEIPHRPVASMQIGEGILKVGQLQLLDHTLDQLGVADRRRSGQAAGRAWTAPPKHRSPGRLGHLRGGGIGHATIPIWLHGADGHAV